MADQETIISDFEKQIRTLEAKRDFLKQEADSTLKDLNNFLDQSRLAESQTRNCENELKKANLELDSVKNERISEENKVNAQRQKFEDEKKPHKESLAQLKKEEKEALKELQLLNTRITNGKEQLFELDDTLNNKNSEIVERDNILKSLKTAIAELGGELSLLEAKKAQLFGEISIVQNKIDDDLKKWNEEVSALTHLADLRKEEASRAEQSKRNFDNEYMLKKQDLDIYMQRVEYRYKEAFPGRAMPMIK